MKWAVAIAAPLIVSGVIGVWSMSSSLARLDERVANLTIVVTEKLNESARQITDIAREQRDHARRIDALENKIR
ncbi:MAG TPA: hypothetical protein PKD55_05575 [Bellilinea sp.]|nr:hypothetical protein [Bellilinea sp.]